MMRKKMLFPALAVLMLAMTACSPKEGEYTDALPPHIEVLASIHPASLAEKAGLDQADNQTLLQKLKQALKGDLDAATYEYVGQLLEHPSQSGIDLEAPIYFFSNQTLPQGGCVAKVTNENDVKTLVGQLQKKGIVNPPSEAEGYTWADGNLTLAYNASTLLVLGHPTNLPASALPDSLHAWMHQNGSQSFSQSAAFKQMQGQRGDVKLLYPYGGLLAQYVNFMGYPMPLSPEQLNDLRITAGLSFEKGRIDLTLAPYTENEEVRAWIEQQAQVSRPIRNTFIDCFPASTLLLVCGGIDGNALYGQLASLLRADQLLSASDAECVRQLLGMFHDDFTLGLINVMPQYNSATFLACATVTDEEALSKFIQSDTWRSMQGTHTQTLPQGDNEYILRWRGHDIFFGVRDGRFYATNDKTISQHPFQKCTPSAAQTAYADGLKGRHAVFVLNVEAISQMPFIKMLKGLAGAQYTPAFAAADRIAYLKSESDGQTGLVSLQLKDTDTNALEQLIGLLKAALL